MIPNNMVEDDCTIVPIYRKTEALMRVLKASSNYSTTTMFASVRRLLKFMPKTRICMCIFTD
jgi:hypothetical protein